MKRHNVISIIAICSMASTANAFVQPSTVDIDIRSVVERYYGAINRGDYMAAYIMYPGMQSYEKFVAGFSRTARTTVTVGPAGALSVADGHIGTNVSVDVYATLKNGRHQHFQGNYSLLRDIAFDGVGASPWRITAGCLSTAGRGGCAYRRYRD